MKIIDGHCDTLTHLLDKSSSMDDISNHVNIDALIMGGVNIQFFAAWIGPRQRYGSPLQRGIKLIDRYYTMLDEYSAIFVPVFRYADVKGIKHNQIGSLLTVEGGDILEGEIANLRVLHKLGVRLMTLTWNNRNEISDGIMETSSRSGLSRFGASVVREMNRLNMLIDLSHISVRGFWDAIEHSSDPVIATHSNARAICSHPRNLDDDQILAISEVGGIVGINFYPPFLTDEKEAHIEDIIRHIEYISGLVGIDSLGFGSDFDGIEQLPEDVGGPGDFPKIIERLLRLNYSERDVQRICSDNHLRVIKRVLK
ncbi:MAG TPA: dipeptidase [Clostridia bacterium]|nr:dipeptidase [Clostridia bacterium]